MGTSSYIPKEGERIRYFRGSADGHGGHAEEHREEMRAIAEQIVQTQVPIIAAQMINEAIDSMIGAIDYDIKTVVRISFDEVDTIFKSEKLRQYVSNRIASEIKANLQKLKYRL